METEFNSENKNRLKRRDQQEAVGVGRAVGARVKFPYAKEGSRTILQAR